jgi:hypothetical protein
MDYVEASLRDHHKAQRNETVAQQRLDHATK